MTNRITNKNGVKLLAALAVFAIAFAAVAVASSDVSDAAEDATTDAVAKIGDQPYSSLDSAISAANETTGITTITLLDDVRFAENGGYNLANVIIKSEDNAKHKITMMTNAALSGIVKFENVEFAAASPAIEMLMYSLGSDVQLFMTNVSFDQSCAGQTVYMDQSAHADFTDCDFTNTLLYFGGNAAATLDDVTNIDINIGSDTNGVTIGTDITLGGDTSIGTIQLVGVQLTIPADKELNAENIKGYGNYGGSVDCDGTLNVGTITVPLSGDGNITIQNEPADRTFTNNITLGDGVAIDSASAIIASYTQEVVITGDVTVVSGGYMQILGKLTILDNASLTIRTGGNVSVEEYGIVDVKGDLIIEGATSGNSFAYSGIIMTVSGSVSLEGKDSFLSTGEGIEISGTFDVGNEATAQLNGATITKDGTLSINGIVEGTVTNNGTISIDSQGLEDGSEMDLTVQLGAEGTVDVINVFGTITVSDSELTFTQGGNSLPAQYNNIIEVTNVTGVKITETLVVSERNGNYAGKNTMNIAGTIVTAVDYNATVESGNVTITGGNIATLGDVVLGNGITMTVDGKVTVTENLVSEYTGTVSASPISGDGEMTVEGKVTAKVPVQVETVNAARYTTASPAYTIYTTLETALTDGATSISLMGENSVAADTTIPVGTTVLMETGSELTISDKAVLTVAADDRNSARFDTRGTDSVKVNGTLIVTNFAKSKVNEDSILSDTSKAVEKTRTYTNIYKALTDAAEGETVEIARGDDLTLTKDIEVKAGVTLSIPAGEKIIVDNGLTVTVNGTVYVADDYENATADPDATPAEKAGTTIVNGLFLYVNEELDFTEEIVGAYFEYFYKFNNSTTTVNAIAPLASVPGIMDKVRSDITLHGKMTVSTVDFSAYDGDAMGIVASNQIAFDTITLGSSVTFAVPQETADKHYSATGTLVLANGSIDVKNINGFKAYNNTDAEDVTTSYFTGAIDSYDDSETAVVEKGSAALKGTITADLGTTANVSVSTSQDSTITIDTIDVITDRTFNGPVTVDGALTIAENGFGFKDLTVSGTITAEEGKTAGAEKIYIGVTSEDFAMAGTGSIEGITLTTDATSVAYVSPNATVGESFDGLKSTEYYVEDALYLTAYANEGNSIAIAEVEFTIENARFDGWMDEDGNILEAEPADAAEKVGSPSKVYADITYEIFEVKVIVDSGVGAVAIDGNVLENASGNVFTTASFLKAGEHTVTYTLKSGYTGEAKLSVSGEGVTISGMNFTLAGTPAPGQTIPVQLSLFGTTVSDTPSIVIPSQPAESDDGMGLTEYLLIVLVVLAAILVIIVSIRMMRS